MVLLTLSLQEWVPVVLTDQYKMSKMPLHPPLSTAYLSGVPAKRRKVTFLLFLCLNLTHYPLLAFSLGLSAAGEWGGRGVVHGRGVGLFSF